MVFGLKAKNCIIAFFSSAFLAFGLYNVHSVSGVTEGGVLGLTLLFEHWFDISPSVTGAVMNFICYALGFKLLGKSFVGYSLVATIGFSAAYAIFEASFPPLFSFLSQMPLAAALIGAVFVGVGAGLCVRMGGAPGGDDALAMALSHLLKCKIEWVYLASDLIVLLLSLSYIPAKRILYSLLTVVLSGQIVGVLQRPQMLQFKHKK